MSEILFIVGDVAVTTGAALMAFAGLVLALLLTIAIVLARGVAPQRDRHHGAGDPRRRTGGTPRRHAAGAGRDLRPRAGDGRSARRTPVGHGAGDERSPRCRHPSRRPVDGAVDPQHHGLAAPPARAAGGDRQRAQEPHRSDDAGDDAARRARQQADARRIRPGAHGSDRAGRDAEGLVRVPVHAVEQQASRLRGVPARPAAALHRREISARGGDRAARCAQRRGEEDRRPARALRTC